MILKKNKINNFLESNLQKPYNSVMKKTYICPWCNKNSAYPSATYPNVLVCRCSGKLEEVGSLLEEQQGSLTSSVDNPQPGATFCGAMGSGKSISARSKATQSYQNFDFTIGHFNVKELSDLAEINHYGKEFNNALSGAGASNFMKIGKIYIAKYNNDETHPQSIMFMINHQTKKAENFVLHNNACPMQYFIDLIKTELKQRNLAQ